MAQPTLEATGPNKSGQGREESGPRARADTGAQPGAVVVPSVSLALEKASPAHPCQTKARVHVEHMTPSIQARSKSACPSALSWLQLQPLGLGFHFPC